MPVLRRLSPPEEGAVKQTNKHTKGKVQYLFILKLPRAREGKASK